jgi:hypothetical protein
VEFIALADPWNEMNQGPPVLTGHLFSSDPAAASKTMFAAVADVRD